MYVRKETKVLSAADCRDLKQACVHARKIGRPLNTLVTFAPYPGSLPSPAARSIDHNRLRSYLDTWMRRRVGEPLTALWVWHSDVTGRNPHVHVFMHCPTLTTATSSARRWCSSIHLASSTFVSAATIEGSINRGRVSAAPSTTSAASNPNKRIGPIVAEHHARRSVMRMVAIAASPHRSPASVGGVRATSRSVP